MSFLIFLSSFIRGRLGHRTMQWAWKAKTPKRQFILAREAVKGAPAGHSVKVSVFLLFLFYLLTLPKGFAPVQSKQHHCISGFSGAVT